jgi:transposase
MNGGTDMTNGLETILRLLAKVFGKQRYAQTVVCLTLMAFGITNSAIKEKLGMSYDTLRKYRVALDQGDVDRLLEFKGERTRSELDGFETEIMKEFNANPPRTLRDAQERIQKLTGLSRSLHRIDVWLKKRAIKVGL